MTAAWEELPMGGDDRVRRLKVPSGWLYQVAHSAFVDHVEHKPGHYIHGWHAPVFVPEMTS